MSTSPIIEVKDLVTYYDSSLILDQINFTVDLGEIFMIVGGSGSGKTTLLHHLIGLSKPFLGDIVIDQQNLNQATEEQYLAILRTIGVLYQSGALFSSMSILDNVSLPLAALTELPQDAILEIAYNKLKIVGLENFTHYLPAAISGGMQKRAAIARAMVLDPKILFLDEPSSGLDPITSSAIDQLVVDLAGILDITFVIVSHDIASIYTIAKRVMVLDQGRIIATGNPQELRYSSDPLVRKFFTSKLVA